MFVNLWSSIVQFGDNFFCGNDNCRELGLDILVLEQLNAGVREKQIWMINNHCIENGTTEQLLRNSYEPIRDSAEAYLILMTQGYADLLHGVPVDNVKRCLKQFAKRGRAFNKRLVGMRLPVPDGLPKNLVQQVKDLNSATDEMVGLYHGEIADLSRLEFTPWSEKGSRPVELAKASVLIKDAIFNTHTNMNQWNEIHLP